MLTNFQNSVTTRLDNKFAVRALLYFLLDIKYIAALPCKIQKVKNRKKLTYLTQ